MEIKYNASFFLRVGLAFIFLFAAISAFVNPQAWIGFMPDLPFGNFITKAYLLFVHDVINLGLGLWLLSGKKVFYSASVAAFLLAGIIVFNWSAMLIVFRDIGLFFAAVALAVMSKKK